MSVLSEEGAVTKLGVKEIQELLLHRYPFLLVDRVNHFKPGQSIEAVKNVSVNEPYFQGHFPGHPIMPGVLVLEALAQAGGILYLLDLGKEERRKSIFVFAGADQVRFKQPVLPGDQLILKVTVIKQRGSFYKISGDAWVDDNMVCSSQIMLART